MALSNSIRIIGGKWRGRRLPFPADTPIRPTLDQVRETLFNWLQPVIVGSRCLDAFSGSGALGLEALSRGASHVTFIDQNTLALQYIQQNLNVLEEKNYRALKLTLPRDLSHLDAKPYDIIFLDPPFQTDLLTTTLRSLATSPLMNVNTLIYIETASLDFSLLEQDWEMYKIKKTKKIAYGLLRKR